MEKVKNLQRRVTNALNATNEKTVALNPNEFKNLERAKNALRDAEDEMYSAKMLSAQKMSSRILKHLRS